MLSSYRFLLGGLGDSDKSGLLFALLQQSTQTEHREKDHAYSFESEQYRYTIIERGSPDEVAQYLLKEASSLDGVILSVSAANALQPHFLGQLELLQYLSVPLHAVILTQVSLCSVEVLAQFEKNLVQQLKHHGLFCEKFELLRYTAEAQNQIAKKLLEGLDERVAFSTPKPPLSDLPLRIFIRPRRKSIGGQTYYLGTLTQGTISRGDSLMTDTWRGSGQVQGLYSAHDPEVPLTQISARDFPTEIFFAVKGLFYHSEFSGVLATNLTSLPSAHRCRALLYVPSHCLYPIETKHLKQIEARFAPVYQGETLHLQLPPLSAKTALLPGSFTLVTLQSTTRALLVDPGTFFTWQTPPNYPGPRLEAVGRVIELL
jgi:hypothetical protein